MTMSAPASAVTMSDGKTVAVNPPRFDGFLRFMEALGDENLPMPDLAKSGVNEWLDQLKQDVSRAAGQDEIRAMAIRQQVILVGLLADVVSHNLETLWRWLLRSPSLLAILVTSCTGKTQAELDQHSAGEFMRLATASWLAMRQDGVLEGFGSFFGALLPRLSSRPGSTTQQAA